MARILIIEDHPANLELMRFLLAHFGHDVRSAGSGETGLTEARSDPPELVLCDVQLPGMSGRDVVTAMKRHPALAVIPVIAVTSFAMVGDRESLLAAGFDGYLAKPIVPETFVGDVERFLAAGAQARPRTDAGTPATTPETVPAADALGAHAGAPGRRATGRRGMILIVDDNPGNRQLARDILEPAGHSVLVADGPEAALRLLSTRTPDLILSDVHLRASQDGFDLLRIVRDSARWRPIPFAFLSASVWRNRDRSRGLGAGADAFILQPIEPQALLDTVEGLLSGRDDPP